MRLTLKAINDELAKRNYAARLAKSTGYFYFQFGEAAFWLDRTVNVPPLESLTLSEWITEFESDTPRRAGGLMGWAASKAVGPWV